jgi:hypothetical protein
LVTLVNEANWSINNERTLDIEQGNIVADAEQIVIELISPSLDRMPELTDRDLQSYKRWIRVRNPYEPLELSIEDLTRCKEIVAAIRDQSLRDGDCLEVPWYDGEWVDGTLNHEVIFGTRE